MHRREALQLLAAGAALGVLNGRDVDQLLLFGRRLHARLRSGGTRPRALDPHQTSTVMVVAERIIPAGETPGATDAGVAPFIDHMLADWYDATDRDRVRAGLAALDDRSRAFGAEDFVGLPEPRQVALLTELDEAADRSEQWFATLKFLTVWGYFTSEVAMRRTLRAFPLPMRYDGCAPYDPETVRP